MGISQPSDKLARSRLLCNALEEASSKLTEFVRRVCEKLGLDPDVAVLASYRRFYEEDLELLREEPSHEYAQKYIIREETRATCGCND
jgi:hypothetical protein